VGKVGRVWNCRRRTEDLRPRQRHDLSTRHPERRDGEDTETVRGRRRV
jgi:hypothetical protein